jgi:hypothetical protein
MPATRPRRIVRRAVMALAACVLLLSGYVLSLGAFNWYAGRRQVDTGAMPGTRTFQIATHIYAPLMLYSDGDLPGGRFISTFAIWCRAHGTRTPMTWADSAKTVDNTYRIRAGLEPK